MERNARHEIAEWRTTLLLHPFNGLVPGQPG